MLQRIPADVTIADEASSRRSILQTFDVLPQAQALGLQMNKEADFNDV